MPPCTSLLCTRSGVGGMACGEVHVGCGCVSIRGHSQALDGCQSTNRSGYFDTIP